ncbi:MAG: PhzF family phenazine biosynthesis protein [Alphaproteobacteria bacterium]|nr:PhzF family phenazine biosynthesis protein [Alphaproteobacteria bacterium]
MSELELPIYQVDAFADRLFAGNPAAVVPLKAWLPDATMQTIAAENNLSETAFFVPEGPDFGLRWFTPVWEVPLCGHATLASAFVIATILEKGRSAMRFNTKSGVLQVTKAGELFTLDFPARDIVDDVAADYEAVAEALGAKPVWVKRSAYRYLALFETAAEVESLKPDMGKLKATPKGNAMVTAPGTDCDFVSRYFAPFAGIDEDPVTGSAHSTLIPYWAQVLGKKKLHARQVSARGGTLWCEDAGERVYMAGTGKLYMSGTIKVPA